MARINGKIQSISGKITIEEFLREQGFDSRKVAVEKNHEIIKRQEFANTFLDDEDSLEIVSFVGGG